MAGATGGEAGINDDDEIHHAAKGAHEKAQFGGFAQRDDFERFFAGGQRAGAAGGGIDTFIWIGGACGARWATFKDHLELVLVHPIDAESQGADAGLGDEPPELLLAVDGGEPGGEKAATKEPENSDACQHSPFGSSGENVTQPGECDTPHQSHGIEINRFFDFLLGHERREFSVG